MLPSIKFDFFTTNHFGKKWLGLGFDLTHPRVIAPFTYTFRDPIERLPRLVTSSELYSPVGFGDQGKCVLTAAYSAVISKLTPEPLGKYVLT